MDKEYGFPVNLDAHTQKNDLYTLKCHCMVFAASDENRHIKNIFDEMVSCQP